MIFKGMISAPSGSFREAVEDQKPCGQISQLCRSGGSWRNEMEFLRNICTTELVKSIKERAVYTNKLMACTEQEVIVSFAGNSSVPVTALLWGLWQHNILFFTCEWNLWELRNISFSFLLDTITTVPSCLFHNNPQFFFTLHFFVSLFISFLVFLRPVLSYIPSFCTFFLYILYLSSALPRFSFLALHPSFFLTSPSPGSPSYLLLPLSPSLSLLVTGLMAEVWYDLI